MVLTHAISVWYLPTKEKELRIEYSQMLHRGDKYLKVDDKIIYTKSGRQSICGTDTIIYEGIIFNIIKKFPSDLVVSHNLRIGDQDFKDFKDQFYQKHSVWKPVVNGRQVRVLMDKDSLDVWVDGLKMDLKRSFIDSGTVSNFVLEKIPCKILSEGAGEKRSLTHTFLVNDVKIPAHVDNHNGYFEFDVTRNLRDYPTL